MNPFATTSRAARVRWVSVSLIGALWFGAATPYADAAPSSRGYDWPLAPRPPVTRGFAPPDQRWESGHRGVDLGSAPESAVLAAGAGTVSFAGAVAGRPVVSVLHPDGILTTYEPVAATVRRGDRVATGTVLGHLVAGHRGCEVAACLHWGARSGSGREAVYLNPLSLVGAVTIRLKPLRPGDAPDRGPPAAAPR